MSQLLFFFSFNLVRIKNLETLFWSHKPSPSCCAKSKLTAFGWSEPWVWRYKTPLNELWILLNYALGKTGVSGQPNYSGLQPNRHFFFRSFRANVVPGTCPSHPKAPQDSAVPRSLQTSPSSRARPLLKPDGCSLWLIWN